MTSLINRVDLPSKLLIGIAKSSEGTLTKMLFWSLVATAASLNWLQNSLFTTGSLSRTASTSSSWRRRPSTSMVVSKRKRKRSSPPYTILTLRQCSRPCTEIMRRCSSDSYLLSSSEGKLILISCLVFSQGSLTQTITSKTF